MQSKFENSPKDKINIPEDRQLSESQKGYVRMRSIRDFGMGILWLGMGAFILFAKHIQSNYDGRFDEPLYKGLAILFIVYGAFRIYRGISKKYFTKK